MNFANNAQRIKSVVRVPSLVREMTDVSGCNIYIYKQTERILKLKLSLYILHLEVVGIWE